MSNQKTYAKQLAREERDASRRLPEHMRPSDPAERMGRYDNEGRILKVSDATHTPGPWKVAEQNPTNGDTVIIHGYEWIARALDFNDYDRDAERHANANLIAAGPDLLRAAINALADLDNLTSGEYAAGADQASRDELRTAIARARGEE